MDVRLETKRLWLVTGGVAGPDRVCAFYVRNEERLAALDPPRPNGFFTVPYWRERIEDDQDDLDAGHALRLRMLLKDDSDGPVIGNVSFTNVMGGPLGQCFLGYSIDAAHEGRGLMYEALRSAIPYAFERFRLHRISANYLPTNERSGRLLRRLGFVVEGYARDYLYVGGAWRDHVLTALVDPSGRPPEIE